MQFVVVQIGKQGHTAQYLRWTSHGTFSSNGFISSLRQGGVSEQSDVEAWGSSIADHWQICAPSLYAWPSASAPNEFFNSYRPFRKLSQPLARSFGITY